MKKQRFGTRAETLLVVSCPCVFSHLASDNSLSRCYISRCLFASTCYIQRITDSSVSTQWSTWTALPGSSGIMFQDGGIAVSNNPGSPNTLRVFAQRGTGGNQLYNWYSTDNGQTWAGPGTVVSPQGGALTKGIGSAGNNDVFFLYGVVGGEAMGASFYTSSWSTITTWTLPPIASLDLSARNRTGQLWQQ